MQTEQSVRGKGSGIRKQMVLKRMVSQRETVVQGVQQQDKEGKDIVNVNPVARGLYGDGNRGIYKVNMTTMFLRLEEVC